MPVHDLASNSISGKAMINISVIAFIFAHHDDNIS
jgi:hypothetical protein